MFKAQIPYAPYFYLQVKVGCNTWATRRLQYRCTRQHGAKRQRISGLLQGLLASAAVQDRRLGTGSTAAATPVCPVCLLRGNAGQRVPPG